MDAPLNLYKSLVDGLATLHKGVHRAWIERGWPDVSDASSVRQLLAKLTPDEKKLLADLLESARDGGVHDTLVYLNDRMAINGLRFTQEGIELAHQPFDTELYYDWTSRRQGDNWPDEDEES
jgi:hypothetical protein